MRIRFALLCSVVWGLAISGGMAQTPALSSIEAPYPAVQSAIRIAGSTYGSGAVPYGPAGTPLILSGKNFATSGSVLFPGAQRGTTVQAAVTSWSPSILMLTVPSGATSGLVYVNAGGKTSNGLPFLVTPGVYAGTCPGSPPSSELEITTSSLPNGTVGQAYSATLNATDGTPPYTWSLTGSPLPAGLSLSASSGAITGTPTAVAGPVNLTVKAVDSKTQATEAVLGLTVTSQSLGPGIVYSYTVPSSGYAPNGNLLSYTDSIMGTWSFGYDNLNRLISGTPGTGAPSAYANMFLCLNYDAFGNRTQYGFQSAACPSNQPAVTYPSSNRVPGLSYDAAGNVLYDGTSYYAYDGEGRLCAVQTNNGLGVVVYEYIYDAEGRRVAKGTITPSQPLSCNTANNGFTLMESYVLGQGGEQLTTTSWNGTNSNWARTNVYGDGRLLATYDTEGLHFHLADPLGTRRVQTDPNGVVESAFQSLPFGDQLNPIAINNAPPTADDATPLHFTGKERDAESGNDYFGARYYASMMGRFLSPDAGADETLSVPVPYADLENPQSLNLYSYVTNNPLRFTDLDGHAHWGDCNDGSGAQCLFGDKLGERSWQNGQWVYWNGSAWDNHPPINDPGLIDLSGGQLLMVAPIGKLVGPLVGSAASEVGEVISGALGKTATKSAAGGGTKMLLTDGTKQAAKTVVDGMANGAQKASVKRAVAGAISRDSISIAEHADGSITVTKVRPGADGFQAIVKNVDPSGASVTVQGAYDAEGNLVHLDPKN